MAAKIVKASFPGHAICRPHHWRAPYIFASPHSGRDYPARFLADSILPLADLRRSEDAYVDTLLPDAAALGVPVLTARFPRAFVDVNRNAREMDPFMFSSSPSDGVEIRSARVMAGFGVIPKYAAEGRAIYGRKLSAAEGRARMTWCYTPYHDALKGLIAECLTRFGTAIIIDWHSMPSTAVCGTRPLADMVLGDRHGSSTDAAIMGAWEQQFAACGLQTARNSPYAGGYVTSQYGQPRQGVHALQIEINRGLYLDERKVTRRRHKFDTLRGHIDRVSRTIIDGAATPLQFAAE